MLPWRVASEWAILDSDVTIQGDVINDIITDVVSLPLVPEINTVSELFEVLGQ